MRKWLLFVFCLVLFGTLNSQAGTMKDSLSRKFNLDSRELTPDDFIVAADSALKPTFNRTFDDATFMVYETFFRKFIDGYETCLKDVHGEDYFVIQKADMDKKDRFYIEVNYPFLTDDGCEYMDVTLYYDLKKDLDNNTITFSFENDYGAGKLAVELWILAKNYKSIVPRKTTVKLFVSDDNEAFMKVSTEAHTNIPRTVEEEEGKTVGESMESHNKELIDDLEEIVDEKIIATAS